MSNQTYTIEIKIDCDDEQHAAMEQVMVQMARDWVATAMLLTAGKQPKLMCRTQDAFYDEKEIDALAEQINLDL